MQSHPWEQPDLFNPRRPSPAASEIRQSGVIVSYGTGDPIYVEGDHWTWIYGVVSGAVRTARHSVDGRRQIGDFYYPGDVFGLESGSEHAFTAEAISPTKVIIHRPQAIRGDRDGDHVASSAALSELARVQTHLAMLGRRSASEKVASFLVDVARRTSPDSANLPMSRQDMADYLGVAIETVSRVLGQFQDEGLVAFQSCRDFRIVQRAALKRLAES